MKYTGNKNLIRNTGLILEPLTKTDWLFGSSNLGMAIRVPDGDWTPYLPTGEKQRRNDEDKMWCVSGSALNTIETEFGYFIDKKLIATEDLKWLEDNGYLDENGRLDCSDRHIAIASKTTSSGNTPKRVAEAIGTRTDKSKEFGLIPETMLPYRKDMTWLECYGYGQWDTPNTKLITQEMLNLGREFLQRFPIHYEFPNSSEFDEALKRNPIQVFVHAWNGMKNGEYIRTTSGINHAVEGIKNRPNQRIFDTYEPYIKSLASDFIFMSYGVRYIISIKSEVKKKTMQKEQLEKLYQLGLHRETDNGATGYLNHESEFVIDELLKSKEFDSIDKLVKFVRLFGFSLGRGK